jgi:quercetin dioxygenase-like cupin family protein
MRRVEVEPAHIDHRGEISDLILEQIDAITRITFSIGAIRGNHVHKETTQWTYIVSGRIEAFSDNNGELVSEIFEPGDMFVSLPGDPHAMRAILISEILVFTRGPRSGADYASDTFKFELI